MRSTLARWLPQESTATDTHDLVAVNAAFGSLDATARIARALEILPRRHVLASSFGAQSAVMLHLVTRIEPDIPVVLIDTGYLFPETYRFIDEFHPNTSEMLLIAK